MLTEASKTTRNIRTKLGQKCYRLHVSLEGVDVIPQRSNIPIEQFDKVTIDHAEFDELRKDKRCIFIEQDKAYGIVIEDSLYHSEIGLITDRGLVRSLLGKHIQG